MYKLLIHFGFTVWPLHVTSWLHSILSLIIGHESFYIECSKRLILSASRLCSQPDWSGSFRGTMERDIVPVQGKHFFLDVFVLIVFTMPATCWFL